MAKSISIPNMDQAFKAPAQAGEVLRGALQSVLHETARSVLGTAIADGGKPHDGEILPELRRIRRKQWSGAWPIIEPKLMSYRQAAEEATAQIAAAAEDGIRVARLEEQRQQGPLRVSALYTGMSRSLAAVLEQQQAGDADVLLTELRKDTDFVHDDASFTTSNDRRLRSPGSRRARYDELQVRCAGVMRLIRERIDNHQQRVLIERLAKHVTARTQAIVSSRTALLEAASDDEKRRARAQSLASTAIAKRKTSAKHFTSMPPAPAVIESRVREHEPYVTPTDVNSDALLIAVGAWASEDDWLPADETKHGGVADAVRAFARARMSELFGGLDLARLYGSTPLPVAELVDRSAVSLRLVESLQPTLPNQHVRFVEAPADVSVDLFDTLWERVRGGDPNRIQLLQDLRGFSPWAFLGLDDEASRQALANADEVLDRASTPQLQRAVRQCRIIERMRGEVVAVRGVSDAEGRQTSESVSDDDSSTARAHDESDDGGARRGYAPFPDYLHDDHSVPAGRNE